MGVDAYTSGRSFEMLMRKVFPLSKVNRHRSALENAITMEQGHTYAKGLGTAEKQFKEVQDLLDKILEKISTAKPYKSASPFFKYLQLELPPCRSTRCLTEVVNKALEKANSFNKKE